MAARAAPTPRALVFDIGRVIVRVNVKRALAALGTSANLSAEQVGAAIDADPCKRDFQEGRMTPPQWHEHLVDRFGMKLSFEQFCAVWNSALDPQTILSENLFARLAAGFRLALLSNTDPIHVAHLEAHFSFPRYFPARIYSCAVGASKPDQAIYRRAILETRLEPKEILYIDDTPEYVEAGLSTGMQAVVFQGAEQLLEDFRQRGILQL